MKITDLRCAVIGKHPIVRIVTDEGLHGLGEVEYTKTYLKPWVLHFREALIGEDPTDVERVHAEDPPARLVQALWRRRQRHRACAVGHRRQGGGRAGLQAARRQGARQGAGL